MKQYENVLLVTGGAGFIGSAFLRMLVPKYPNWYFINFDALTYAGDLKKVESVQDYENYAFVHGNICDRTLVKGLFYKYKINIVVNFAAESHVDNSIKESSSFIKSNIEGTFVLLDTAKAFWGFDGYKDALNFYRFIQISTDEVYGTMELTDESWTEDSKLSPNSPYSASKAAAEMICRSYNITFKLPIIITRSSNNFGPYQNFEKLIPRFINCIFNNEDLPLYGDGSNIRDWIYVEDNIIALELVLLKGEVGEIYNIGGDYETSNIRLAELLKSLVPSSKSEIIFVDERLGHDFRYSINSKKIHSLGFHSKHDFSDALINTINFYKDVNND